MTDTDLQQIRDALESSGRIATSHGLPRDYFDHALVALDRVGERIRELERLVAQSAENADVREGRRQMSFSDRLAVGGIASALIDAGNRTHAKVLLDAVRCCGEFPECAHVLAWVEAYDGAPAPADLDRFTVESANKNEAESQAGGS